MSGFLNDHKANLSARYLENETQAVNRLLPLARLSDQQNLQITKQATSLIEAVRAAKRRSTDLNNFLQEYDLSSDEGVALMCVAETLLRIPDNETIDQIIAEKIGDANWHKELKNKSVFMSAARFGLQMTGGVLRWGSNKEHENAAGWNKITGAISRLGEPVIRAAMRRAMGLMGKQFILGETIEQAIRNSEKGAAQGYRFSYDMLGEAAKTQADADRYFQSYKNAINEAAKLVTPDAKNISERPNISIKLSALHPRYEPSQQQRVMTELLPRIKELASAAIQNNVGLTIDAEESERLILSLELFESLQRDPAITGGAIGLAVQAYSKRAYGVLQWLAALSAETGKKIPVRLVKGAYWDSEIKRAQEQGYESYPVFTRKVATDVSYLACANFMLSQRDAFYPMFGTHNAYTVAAILTMASDGQEFEFQRLQGMGESLSENYLRQNPHVRCRIYAPVGIYSDLLPYLVRRLLENGANSSFVHQIANVDVPVESLIASPVAALGSLDDKPHPQIPLPADLYGGLRKNSHGFPMHESSVRQKIINEIEQALVKPVQAGPIIAGQLLTAANVKAVFNPANRDEQLGTVANASTDDVNQAFAHAKKAQEKWDQRGGCERATILNRAADLFEQNYALLFGLLIKEGGKTLANAQGELREAVDFLRYYALQSYQQFETPNALPGPTGEANLLSLHGRGVFVCISPWNFPLAIFTGQVAAALAAGNAVIAKPAAQTPLVAFAAVQLLHQAGIPADILHFVPGPGGTLGPALTSHSLCAGVAFTGSTEVAWQINQTLAARRTAIAPLIAETGGQNAMIVDSSALTEQVVNDVIVSAFDSAGQRCSALRVLFLQNDIADKTIDMLKGAMDELRLGNPYSYETDIGPAIDQRSADSLLEHTMKMRGDAKFIHAMTVPVEAANGSFIAPHLFELQSLSQLTGEVFGPVLHIIRFDRNDIDKVCDDINDTGFGLTLGIHSRSENFINKILSRVHVGNAYVNRTIIGAIVGVQPFGGEGLSGTGPKAGGPHYLYRFAAERTLSVNTTASGGNASLLTMNEGV